MRLYVIILIAIAVSVGCDRRFGDGSGEVTGRVCLNPDDPRDCDDYDMGASWFTLEKVGDNVYMEIRDSSASEEYSDNLVFLITEPDTVVSSLGEAIPLAEAGIARPEIHLLHSYGFSHYPITVAPDDTESTITFDAFGTDSGEDVKATFRFNLIGRQDRKLRGYLKGWLELVVTDPIAGNNMENRDY